MKQYTVMLRAVAKILFTSFRIKALRIVLCMYPTTIVKVANKLEQEATFATREQFRASVCCSRATQPRILGVDGPFAASSLVIHTHFIKLIRVIFA